MVHVHSPLRNMYNGICYITYIYRWMYPTVHYIVNTVKSQKMQDYKSESSELDKMHSKRSWSV